MKFNPKYRLNEEQTVIYWNNFASMMGNPKACINLAEKICNTQDTE